MSVKTLLRVAKKQCREDRIKPGAWECFCVTAGEGLRVSQESKV